METTRMETTRMDTTLTSKSLDTPTSQSLGELRLSDDKLEKEIVFLKSFMTSHPSSLVSNLRIKHTHTGSPRWIDIQKCTVHNIDNDLVIDEELHDKLYRKITYKDRDY